MIVNAFVGSMVGQERTIVPLIADKEFGLALSTVMYETLPARRTTSPAMEFPSPKAS